jgi:hypothetical protein
LKTILKAIVGSQAHGLATPESDIDYRGVFIHPISEIVHLNHMDNTGNVQHIEGLEDMSNYELKHYLNLAIRSNPSILEVLVSPVKEITPEGQELKDLFPYLWSSEGVYKAFCGYSHNQLKKFIDEKDSRPWKYMVARIRTLLLGIELLKYGTMTVNVEDQYKILGPSVLMPHLGFPEESISTTLKSMKIGHFSRGMAIDWGQWLLSILKSAYVENSHKESDFDRANDFLLRIRKNNW